MRNATGDVQRIKAYSLTALIETVFHSIGRCSVVLEESFANQSGKVHDVRHSFWISALIHGARRGILGELRVGSQISRAIDGIGRRNGKAVAIGGNAKGYLGRRELGPGPSLNGLGRRTSLDCRTRVIQRSVGTDTRGRELTLRNKS